MVVGDLVVCLDSMLIDAIGSLGANGRRTDVGPPMGLDATFFLVVDFLLITEEVVFSLTGESRGEESDTASSSSIAAAGGEKDVPPFSHGLLKVSLATIL
jgi:hypothetical protein